jgi:hypothetical protein
LDVGHKVEKIDYACRIEFNKTNAIECTELQLYRTVAVSGGREIRIVTKSYKGKLQAAKGEILNISPEQEEMF